MIDLAILNKEQLEAVKAPLSPVLVSAGAGSGKTRVLVYRIAYLIEQGLVSPENILALTFTNKAAKEMQGRVRALLSNETRDLRLESQSHSSPPAGGLTPHSLSSPTLGTFHSMGVRILRQHGHLMGLPKNFTIFDDDDAGKLIKKIIKECEIPEKLKAPWILNLISSAKNALVEPEEWTPNLPPPLIPFAKKAFELYQKELLQSGAADFDDLIILPVKLWRKFPEVLSEYQRRFSYVLVDEYQDTNPAQYAWLKLLCRKGQIFAVGDDAQSIYGFRGSDFSNWQNFQEDFAPVTVIHLEQNYRSTVHILDAAAKVLASSSGHSQKKLWTETIGGEKVTIAELQDEADEAVFVAKTIARIAASKNIETNEDGGDLLDYEYEEESSFSGGGLLDKYLSSAKTKTNSFWKVHGLGDDLDPNILGEIAVLYRTHGQSRALEEVFISSGIKYRIVGGTKFYQRKEVKDVLAILRILLNPQDAVALGRVVDVLPLGVGEKSFPALANLMSMSSSGFGPDVTTNFFDTAIQNLSASSLQTKQKANVLKFLGQLSLLWQSEINDSVGNILQKIVKKFEFEILLKDGTEQGESRWENILELISVAQTRCGGMPWREGADKLLEEAALLAEAGEESNEKCVQLMTIHAAKGLEFDTVFVTGWEEGVLPHARVSFKPEELAEEVRLAYVAMTRARKQLFLTYAKSRMLAGSFRNSPPSRFLRHLPEENIKWNGSSHKMPYSSRPSSSGYTYEDMED